MEVTGQVRDKITGEPLLFATVAFTDAAGQYTQGNGGTVTDSNGNYTLKGEGASHVTAQYVGYKPTTLPVASKVDFWLFSDALLPEFTVYGTIFWPRILAVVAVMVFTIWLLKPFSD